MPLLEENLPLIDGQFLLEKQQGNAGWTYIILPQLTDETGKPVSRVKVSGSIDKRAIRCLNLMPLGQGRFFLPVNQEVRKAIGKKAGDKVNLVLYKDDTPLETPKELVDCLMMEPKAFVVFNSFSESERKYYIEWVYSAKREDTKVRRISVMIDRLLAGKSIMTGDKYPFLQF